MTSRFPRTAIAGAAAVSAFGFEWRGLGAALLDGRIRPGTPEAAAFPSTMCPRAASAVPPIPAAEDAGEPKSRKLMSRPARLAAIAMRKALDDASWSDRREEIGCFLGVGAAGGPMDDLRAILRASAADGRLDLGRFAREGLPATNPLNAFHLLSNYTLCHGAIATGVGGPNGAFYSRGAGTFEALAEAAWALADGECDRALAGAADSAMHPGTWVEIALEGFAARGLVPGEGAALLALTRDCAHPLASLDGCAVRGGRGQPIAASTTAALDAIGGTDADFAVLSAWGPEPRDALTSAVAATLPGARRVDASAGLGDALAAAPALSIAAALDLVVSGASRRAVVLASGIDGCVGGVALSPGGAS